MKNLISHFTVSIVLLLVFSCNNDFLKNDPAFFAESSTIVISPAWPAQDYSILCEGIGNAKFTISHAPEWLDISSQSGQFTNNIAILNCKAKVHKDFSEIGVYHSFVTLSVEGKGNLAIPVIYFIEGNPAIEVASSLNLGYNNWNNLFFGQLLVKNTGNGILFWEILELPEWLTNEQNNNNYNPYVLGQNGQGMVTISYNPNVPFQENLSGKIVLITNDKNKPVVEIDVKVDWGNPVLDTWDPNIDFGRTETTRYFSISNQGNGVLAWRIDSCPEWLTVSGTSGNLPIHMSTQLTFTCNRELVPSGENKIIIYLKTSDKNNSSYPITITAIGRTVADPDNVKSIEGTISDACFDGQNNILYFTTVNPNRLIAYNVNLRTIVSELPLQNAPSCFSISKDGSRTIIGHNGYITVVDMNSFSATKTLAVDYNIFDIEWGDGDWVCYTPRTYMNNNLQWKNINTEQIYDTPYNGLHGCLSEKSVIKKIPYQNYIIGSQTIVSSSGIYLIDIRTRNIEMYFFQDLLGYLDLSLWFSQDGKYLYSALGDIFETSPLYTQTDLHYDLQKKRFSPDPSIVFWAYHDSAAQSVWILATFSIIQYNDADFTSKATYYYDDVYNGRGVLAHYVFANKDGTELVVIRNATTGDAMWSLEFIPITK